MLVRLLPLALLCSCSAREPDPPPRDPWVSGVVQAYVDHRQGIAETDRRSRAGWVRVHYRTAQGEAEVWWDAERDRQAEAPEPLPPVFNVLRDFREENGERVFTLNWYEEGRSYAEWRGRFDGRDIELTMVSIY